MENVTLGELKRQARRRARYKPTVDNKKFLSLVSRACDQWGYEVAVYKNCVTRHQVANSVAHRLGLSPTFVRDRFDMFHRRADYDQERKHSALEG